MPVGNQARQRPVGMIEGCFPCGKDCEREGIPTQLLPVKRQKFPCGKGLPMSIEVKMIEKLKSGLVKRVNRPQ